MRNGVGMVFGAALAAAGCGDEATTITVHAYGATLVAIDVGDGWQAREPGDVTFPEPAGLYRIAVTCRSDIGDTVFDLAAPGDGVEYDRDCLPRPAGRVEVTFDVTGDVDGMFIGDQATYGDERTVMLAPGTYDVVATADQPPHGATRAQVVRDLIVDGPTHVAIDVGRLGVSLEEVEVRSTPAYDFQSVTGYTARGTWFQTYGDRPRRLPAAVRKPDDEHWLDLVRFPDRQPPPAGSFSESSVRIGDGAVDVALPTSEASAAFTLGPPPAIAWSSLDGWGGAFMWLAQDNEYGVPGWRLRASRRALDAGAVLAWPGPPPGWKPSWTVDTSRYYRWGTRAWRTRADGGWESIVIDGGVFDPTPPPRATAPRLTPFAGSRPIGA